MSKRVRFDEDSLIATKSAKFDEQPTSSVKQDKLNTPGSRFKENHSIDSDEEDEENEKKEDYEKLTEEDVEGAEGEEDGDGDYDDDGTRITPFNLKEEMEEGDFDKSGHYHFSKEKEIRDNWLDNIDWVKIKKTKASKDMEMSDDDEGKEEFDEKKVIQGIVHLLQKGETVSKGLRRLGGADSNKKKKSNTRSWQREKVYDMEATDETTTDKSDKNDDEALKKAQFLQLTELADQMAGAGYYDIYSDTFEKLQHKLNSLCVSEQAALKTTDDADDALDIFADDIDAADLEKPTESKTGRSQDEVDNVDDNSVKWEYKWNDEASKVFGPFTSEQMAEWKEQGYFKDGVKVRRKDREDAPFYNASRIDFDLFD
ncbi:CD2 antigen cytoplasmic tail-binding protein 2 homolog [Clavelina lepadiformis]|uniref:CD2 antigen cytoplasmic tail-binding protein 2 homolog n=1 Tax=Clavelina lepadiformis TaxID=159417 RepID=UPI00404239D7